MVTNKALGNVQSKILKNTFPEGLSSSQTLAWRTQICPPENSPNGVLNVHVATVFYLATFNLCRWKT